MEIEDIILRKILLVSLVDSMENDTRVVYLHTTAKEILDEGKELRLSRDLMERVLIDRLSGNFVRLNPFSVFGQLLPSGTRRGNAFLLLLVFSEVSSSVDAFGGSNGSGGVSSPPGFLDELFRDGDFDSMDPILKQLYEDLRGTVLKVSALGNFQQPLRALLFLPAVFLGIVNTSSRRSPCLLSQQSKLLRNNLYDGLTEVLMSLLKNTTIRENVLGYLAAVINKNSSRAHLQVDPLS
ncbi:hypothetical protein HAX54_052392 [Datura stramonium]|uniref:Ubiquitin conjugation factor E4 core domain-containing protein n=1 Tax=Datura stramonium TaxID=4076 RepID=A0ABS8WR25_DATST|nr:hypothetical protein [Datura stramonium]